MVRAFGDAMGGEGAPALRRMLGESAFPQGTKNNGSTIIRPIACAAAEAGGQQL